MELLRFDYIFQCFSLSYFDLDFLCFLSCQEAGQVLLYWKIIYALWRITKNEFVFLFFYLVLFPSLYHSPYLSIKVVGVRKLMILWQSF